MQRYQALLVERRESRHTHLVRTIMLVTLANIPSVQMTKHNMQWTGQ